MGQIACEESDGVLTGEDADAYDGDAALRIFVSPARPGTLTWSTGSFVRQVALVEAERTFVH